VNLFARIQPKSALCARIGPSGDGNCRVLALDGVKGTNVGALNHRANARLAAGTTVRVAVVGAGCTVNVADKWLAIDRLPPELTAGQFQVGVEGEVFKVSKPRFVSVP
jgi:hypothetical protein